jgi:hypothetical protein
MMLHKLRIALAVTLLALTAVSLVDGAAAWPEVNHVSQPAP